MAANRSAAAALTALLAVALTGCATVLAGQPVKAAHDINAEGADLAALETGNYPIAPRAPLGTAGNDKFGTILEGHRMANNVVLPTDIDNALTEPLSVNIITMQQNHGISVELPDPGQAIVTAHRLLAGFATARRDKNSTKNLINMVLRFPDPGAAADAAQQLSTQIPPPYPKTPFPVPRYPTALSTTMDTTGIGQYQHAVEAFLPHGPYLLYAWAQTAQRPDDAGALIANLFDRQVPKIDAFSPTPADQLASLPVDAVGFLNVVLPADKDAPGSVNFGGFEPYAALHFQDDPMQALADFTAAGVDAVAQLRTVVYHARDAAGAKHLLESTVAAAGVKPGAQPTDGVNGLPFAKCFEFTQADQSMTPRFGCFATADRYQFEAWSQQGHDARQQIAAQYLMLTS
jgi:hypothetical protein